jgi:NADH/F420H2 dehydrogenase subunit C
MTIFDVPLRNFCSNYNKILNFSNFVVCILLNQLRMIVINRSKENFNIYLNRYEDIDKIAFFFKKHTMTQYVALTDLFAIDLLNKNLRFNIVYCLLSLRYNSRIRLYIYINENSNVIKSLTSIYKSTLWVEREVWDMFGIFFIDHKDLRRILTDYGFEGFPLRKDFPLSGFVELRYDDSMKRIVYEPLEITQEYRFFDFESPWDNFSNFL